MDYLDRPFWQRMRITLIPFMGFAAGVFILLITTCYCCAYMHAPPATMWVLSALIVATQALEFNRQNKSAQELLSISPWHIIGKCFLAALLAPWRFVYAVFAGWSLQRPIAPDIVDRLIGFSEHDQQILQCLHEKGVASIDEIWLFLEGELGDQALQNKLDSLVKRQLVCSRINRRLGLKHPLYLIDPDVRPLLHSSHPPIYIGNLSYRR